MSLKNENTNEVSLKIALLTAWRAFPSALQKGGVRGRLVGSLSLGWREESWEANEVEKAADRIPKF